MLHELTIKLFKGIVLEGNQKVGKPVFDDATRGFVTNFEPNAGQHAALSKAFKPLPITTLFSVAERKNGDAEALILKQLTHYFEVYGLGAPGLFNLEVTRGNVVVIANVRGFTKDDLGELIRGLIYANAPVRELDSVVELLEAYDIPFDLALVKNNEARIRLYRERDRFTSGDDAVRYVVFKTTGNSLLIKSPDVIEEVRANRSKISQAFLIKHKDVLAQVFNRHKRLIMALKDQRTATTINRISRASKTQHVPLPQALNKVFVNLALTAGRSREVKEFMGAALEGISLRDKFKYLNLLEWKRLQRPDDVFIIRNGRMHLADNRKIHDVKSIGDLEAKILASIQKDFAPLKGKNVLLDPNVDYGLPSSQKQMLGNLPFGTVITPPTGNVISSGIYWENRWGATDLDLSAIDETGERTGWGDYSAYNRKNSVTFSGDITSAPDGAMEFLTSNVLYDKVYGLFVNIYNGNEGAECELVVGSQTSNKSGTTRESNSVKWIKDPVVREKIKLGARGTILGFVRDGEFVVYAPRVTNSRVSGSEITRRLVAKGLAPNWTVRKLLDWLDIVYDLNPVSGKVYDHDLSYSSFSIDKLESLLAAKGVP